MDKLAKIVKKMLGTNDFKLYKIKHEEDDGFYNVFKVESNNLNYILKLCSESEISAYNKICTDSIPKLIKHIKYYNKNYILIEYLEGCNLMHANREKILNVIDSLIEVQKKYWDSNLQLGKSFDEKFESVLNRKKFLFNELLERAYDKFIDVFTKINKTFCHDDLLPFNVIVSNEKAYLIDLEYTGILPFPLSICRFLTHYKEEESYLFYLKEEDKKFAYKYYYDKFIQYKGISYNEYQYIINCFVFYEFSEWVFVYNKYNSKKDERYEYYFNNALKYANMICE